MARWKWILVAVVALLVIGALVQLRRRPQEPYLAEVPLSDGVTKFRLLKMTEGPLDYDWKDPAPELLRMLPPPIGSPHVAFAPVHLDGLTRFDHFPGVSLYFRPVDSQGRYSNGPRGHFSPGIEFQESTGFIFRSRGQFPDADISHFGTAALTRSALPRRDATLKILIHEARMKTTDKPIVMELPNPFYKPAFPLWQGEPLPAVKNVSDTTVTLDGLTFDQFNNDIRADCRIESSVPGWHPGHDTWLEDATGNLGHQLSPFEPAWKVHVSLDPHRESEYPADRVWQIGTYTRPAAETFFELKPPAMLGGVRIESAVLAGAGRLRKENGKLTMLPDSGKSGSGTGSSSSTRFVNGRAVHTHDLESNQPFLQIRHEPIAHGSTVIARLKSGDRIISPTNLSRHTTNGEHSSIIRLKEWPEDQTQWNLELLIVERPDVEFLVTPSAEIREVLTTPRTRF